MTESRSKQAELLKESIIKSGLSKAEISRQVGVTRTSVSRWIKTGYISKEHIIKLSSVLGVDAMTLLHGFSEDKPRAGSLQAKAHRLIDNLSKEKYYKLEEVIRLLEED
ncbi:MULTISPECIES: helix-turn-helix domain-containing protein [Vibrio]|uniref:HTH cro/C1-type domain-containing protein n=1 Tax=Vibrio splendidus TaxID=29497 RepID=A0A2N7JTM1_VIBSP|nr:helix-turn-helix transcriptional regulator [Vibrio splendidus]PMM61594.1 hypothetical protein BCT54_19700 [Vibrio splendidus]